MSKVRVDHERLYTLARRHQRLVEEGRAADAEQVATEIAKALLREEEAVRRQREAKRTARTTTRKPETEKPPRVRSVVVNNVGRGKKQ
jgi:hypothetical protein